MLHILKFGAVYIVELQCYRFIYKKYYYTSLENYVFITKFNSQYFYFIDFKLQLKVNVAAFQKTQVL